MGKGVIIKKSFKKRRNPKEWDLNKVIATRGIEVRDASARTTVTSQGSTDNRDLPESGRRVIGDFTDITLVWGGTYDNLEAVQPSKGDTYTGYFGYPVQVSTLVPRRGNLGQLTILLSDRVEDAGETATEMRNRWEIEWQSIDKDLLQHPYITDDVNADDIVKHIDQWKNSEIAVRSALKYTDENGSDQDLTDKEKEVAQKLLRGMESYVVYAPVMRRIKDYQGRPDDSAACGFIEAPAEVVAGYEYLKTGDRLVQQDDDVWQRVEEWTGADNWDTDIYTTGSGWNGSSS